MALYEPGQLRTFSHQLLVAAGMEVHHANAVADTLVQGDLCGRSSHGVERLSFYLPLLRNGGIALGGEPKKIRDEGATIMWDGNLIAGQYVLQLALDHALERVKAVGIVSVVIRRVQYTGCHEAYLAKATDAAVLMLFTASGPASRRVAPFGATTPVFAPDPFAVGIPTSGDPILLDITMAATSNSVAKMAYETGKQLPHDWLLDAGGNPTANPAVLFEEPLGTIQLLGGRDNGHKGFGILLMIEALTLALGGYGRVHEPEEPCQSIFFQLIDPDAFGGLDAFRREMDHIVRACRLAEEVPGGPPIRIPGERALALRRKQMRDGVEVTNETMDRLAAWALRLGVSLPPGV